tara:strand:+ start:1389 stop:2405 length:1017 start_codon:yes stop_codon:yes gene_type:complete
MKKLSVILFGGNTKKQDGPLLSIAQIAKEKKCDVTIVTDKMHLDLPTKDGKTLQEKLKKNGFDWYKIKDLKLKNLEKISKKNNIGISVNSPWIFKKNIIDFFDGKLYNYHDTPLPKFRGTAAYTWAILQQEKEWGITFHKIDTSLDVGDVIKQKMFKFPKSCKIPNDYLNYKTKFENKFFTEFIIDLKSGKEFKVKKQKHTLSTYWPRLVTPVNGYINWNWNCEQIKLFIHAFDDPHQGSSTFIDGKKIRLKKCLKIDKKMKSHPFQAGLIFRKENGRIFIAASDGAIIINEILDVNDKKINDNVKLGHRLYTPTKFLNSALSNHPNYETIKKIESKN